MKSKTFILTLVLALFLIVFNAYSDQHPEDMGDSTCLSCHTDVTPDVVKQWQQSAHGLIGVECGVCHGDEKNFKAKPSDETCIGCHSIQVENNLAKGKACSSCHIAHNFTVHKVHQYK